MGRTARKRRGAKGDRLTARTADRHVLYEIAVQSTEAEIDFVDRVYLKRHGRAAVRFREDFCGTAATCSEWVQRRPSNLAFGLDLDEKTLAYADSKRLAKLSDAQRERVRLMRCDVRTPPGEARGMDVVVAANFSYFAFKRREDMRTYFAAVRSSLAPGGLFILDHYGGWESLRDSVERRRCKGFTYVWEQSKVDALTHEAVCHIHFEFPDGTKMRRAFSYPWRMWSIPEIRELLAEAGFPRSDCYWEGSDGKGGGNGVFRVAKRAEPCEAHISYIVAEG
ncbi:MAG: methyltransferase domain-containing protein [Planctomycetota bacterium]|nr:methyltransferase domain-containing protein [Planctomycetota bacterium]